MKTATASAKGMTDSQLAHMELRLRRSIPYDQSMLNAIKRERNVRKRKRKAEVSALTAIEEASKIGRALVALANASGPRCSVLPRTPGDPDLSQG